MNTTNLAVVNANRISIDYGWSMRSGTYELVHSDDVYNTYIANFGIAWEAGDMMSLERGLQGFFDNQEEVRKVIVEGENVVIVCEDMSWMNEINEQLLSEEKGANMFGEVETTAFVNEVTLAESLVPSIFVEMFFKNFEQERTLAEREVLAAGIFRTIYRLGEGSYNGTQLFEAIYDNLEYMGARNRDQVKNLRGSDFDVKDIARFIGKDLKAMVNDNGNITLSKEWLNKLYKTIPFAPMPVTFDMERRVPYQKRKSMTSQLGKTSMNFKMQTEFTIDAQMVELVTQAMLIEPKYEGWAKGSLSYNGALMMSASEIYVSEWAQDTNGREYCVPHFGPNPQGGDMDRALYSLRVGSPIHKGSAIHKVMLNELADIVGKKKLHLLEDAVLLQCYEEPLKALIKAIRAGVKKPLQFIRIAKDLGRVVKTGFVHSHFPIGQDAKCSGAQLCAILAGDERMMKATGFCNITEEFPDAYSWAMKYLPSFQGFERDDIKYPFMKKLYGGGVPALLNDQDLMKHCPDNLDPVTFCEFVLTAIESALGPRIMSLREHMQSAALAKCNRDNVEHFKWTHIDGHVVNDVVCNKIDVTNEYTYIRYDQYKARIEFGSDIKQCGIVDISDRIPSRTAFARKIVVSYIHGLDALIQRVVSRMCMEQGIEGLITIHDCFRVAPKDYFRLAKVIKLAYKEVFIDNNPLKHFFDQMGVDIEAEGFHQYLTEDMINQEGAYFFC